MENEPKKPTRKARHLRVPVLPEEEREIKRLASNAGLSVAAYLRNVALGYRLRSMIDLNCVQELILINADLGRLGGLLKLWLTDDPRTADYGEPLIRAVLAKIVRTQDEMIKICRSVVFPRSRT
jgi:hypothetical protein